MRNKYLLTIGCLIMMVLLLAGCQENQQNSSEETNTVAMNDSSKLKTVDDLKDKKIGVILGSIHDAYANKTYPQATIMQYKSLSDMIIGVKTGKIDAAFTVHETFLELMREDGELALLGGNLFRIPIAMGFNQNQDELREKFNIFLKESKSNGVFDDMVKRWINDGITEPPVIDNPKNNGRLIVGVVSDKGMPFAIMKNNQILGFDIELAERFAAYLGKELVLQDMEFASLVPAAVGNKIDMIASTLVITDERKEQIDFSDPYYELGASVFALKQNILENEGLSNGSSTSDPAASQNSGKKMSGLEDIGDKRVGVLTGTIYGSFLAEKYPQAQVLSYSGTADMIMALKGGKIDVIMIDGLSAEVVLKTNPEIAILSDKIMSKPKGIGFNKRNPALREKFNNFLAEARSNGIYDEIYQRWYKDDPEKAVMPKIENNPQGEKIVVGVSVADLPFVAVMNGEYVGLDIELIKRFAEHEGYNLEFTSMEFSALVASLAAGKVDMIADGIAITEERSKQIDFSDSYLEGKTTLIALKKNLTAFEEQPAEAEPAKPSMMQTLTDSFNNNIIAEDRYLLILDGLKVTIIISVLSAIFGTLLGALICLMRMSKNRILNIGARFYIAILRGIPVLVVLMIIFYVVFASVNINPLIVAVIAFGMNFAAYVSEMFRTVIESVDNGQREAGIAGGFTPLQTFIYIIMPQAVRRVLPVYKGEFVSMVKMTSVVGYIAVQDLTKASDIIRSRTFDAFFPLVMVAVLYFMISWLLSFALDYIDIKTDPRKN